MNERWFGALFSDSASTELALDALRSENFSEASFAVACRSARTSAALASARSIEAIRSAFEIGPLADLARATGRLEPRPLTAFRDDLVVRGIDESRARYFDEHLSGDRVLLLVAQGERDDVALTALAGLEADLGLGNGGGFATTIALRRETLDVVKHVVVDREVVVRTEVVREKKTLEIDLEREELVIERTVPGGVCDVIRIPLKHEEAILDKRVIVTAEVRITTEQHVDSSIVEETVAHEILRVEDPAETPLAL